jgi:hypothetical protein
VGAGLGAAAGTEVAGTGSIILTVAIAFAGSSTAAALISAWQRRRSGEGQAAAAKDLSEAAAELGLISARESLRLQQRIVDLSTQIAERTKLFADARIEVHQLKSELASKAAEAEALRLELETERIRGGQAPGRREDDPPT